MFAITRFDGARVRRFVVWCVIALALSPFRGRLERELRATNPVRHSQSATVDSLLRNAFNSTVRETAILVIGGLSSRADSESGRAEVRRLIAELRGIEGVGVVVSPATALDTMLVGVSGHTALVLVGLSNDNPALLNTLRATTARTLSIERAKNSALTMQWTGQPAVLADLRTSGAAAASRAELYAIPVTLLVAWWAFGSIGSALLAVAVAALVTVIGAGAMGLLSVVFAPSAIARSIVSLVGLALTVDYMLLMTRTERDASRGHSNAGHHAARQSRAKSTAMIAAIVVAAGFVGLTIAPTGELRTTAVTGALVAMLAAAGAITLGRSSRTPTHSRDADAGEILATVQPGESTYWLRWGTLVTRHPVAFVVVSSLPLLFLANHARTANLSTPIDNWLPHTSESTQALELLTREQRASVAGTAHVLFQLPGGTSVLSDRGWSMLKQVSAEIRRLPHTGDLHSIESIGTNELLIAQQVFSQGVRDHYISRDGSTALIDVIPSSTNGTADALALVAELRSLHMGQAIGAGAATSETGTSARTSSLMVSGLPAYSIDYQQATRDILPWVVLAATTATLIALLIAYRAPVVVIKAVVLNILVAAAALGATVFVFQDGVGITLLGREVVGSILPTVPLLGFAATFGISMDYELFLLNGVLAERRDGRTEAEAIALGMSRSAGLITRAACVMVAVFSAFAMSDMLPLAMLGFALATAVLLDATLVRLVLAPALLAVAGRWNWWPTSQSKNHTPPD